MTHPKISTTSSDYHDVAVLINSKGDKVKISRELLQRLFFDHQTMLKALGKEVEDADVSN
jgi:hypothetical protein